MGYGIIMVYNEKQNDQKGMTMKTTKLSGLSFCGITYEDMQRVKDNLISQGATEEEIIKRLREMEDHNNKFSAFMMGIDGVSV
jgi:hypothetical protein